MTKTSIRGIRALNRSAVKRVKALAQSVDQLTRQTHAVVLGEITSIIWWAANNPDPGQTDTEFDFLVDEMQDLVAQQQNADDSHTKCWTAFVNNTEGIRIFLNEKRQNKQALTQQDRLRIANQIEGALVAYNKCMTLPRPKRMVSLRD